MRFDIWISEQSSAQGVTFCVDELGLFEKCHAFGTKDFLLRAIGTNSIGIQVGEHGEHAAVFGLRVADCAKLSARLQRCVFTSGAQLVAPMTQWPGIKSMVLRDPSGNRIVIFEDALPCVSLRLLAWLRQAHSSTIGRLQSSSA